MKNLPEPLHNTLWNAAHDRELMRELDPANTTSYANAEGILRAYKSENWDKYLSAVDKAHYDAVNVLNARYIDERLRDIGYETVDARASFLEALDDLEANPSAYLDALDYLKAHIKARDLSLDGFRQFVKEKLK